MNKRQTIIRLLLMFLFITGTFSIAEASTGYTKSIQQIGNNPVQYSYEKEELKKENEKLEKENEELKEELEEEKRKNRYNHYPYIYPSYGFGYGYNGSYIYIGTPRTYIYRGFKPHHHMHRPPHHHIPPRHHGRPHH